MRQEGPGRREDIVWLISPAEVRWDCEDSWWHLALCRPGVVIQAELKGGNVWAERSACELLETRPALFSL